MRGIGNLSRSVIPHSEILVLIASRQRKLGKECQKKRPKKETFHFTFRQRGRCVDEKKATTSLRGSQAASPPSPKWKKKVFFFAGLLLGRPLIPEGKWGGCQHELYLSGEKLPLPRDSPKNLCTVGCKFVLYQKGK